MKRTGIASHATNFHKSLAITLLAWAVALTGLPRWQPARAHAAPAPAVAAPAVALQPKTDFDIYPLTAAGAVQTSSGGKSWPAVVPAYNHVLGYNLARVFSNPAKQLFTVLLNGNTGAARIFELGNDGSLGKEVWVSDAETSQSLRCTSADTVQIGMTTYLITHDAFTGRVRSYPFKDTGTLDFGTTSSQTHDDWRDKNLFSIYSVNGNYYQLGLDTWSGAVLIHHLQGAQVSKTQWTRGWTSVDHLTIGAKTYRLLYKAAGDPYVKNADANDEVGRTVIQQVNANGTSKDVFDQELASGYTSVRFVSFFNGTSWQYGVFFFNRVSRLHEVRPFSQNGELGNILAFGPFMAGVSPAVDVEPYVAGTNTYLALTSDDNATPFSFGSAEQMAHTLHDRLKGKAVGYQFMLSQSGRVIYSRGWGQVKLGDSPIGMHTRTRMDAGSISKMLTTMSVLQLSAAQGPQHVNLSDPVANYVDEAQVAGDSWTNTMNVHNLLTYSAGMKGSAPKCESKLEDFTVDCAPFFAAKQAEELLNPTPDKDGNVTNDYQYDYNNSNFVAARKVIERMTGISTSQQLVDKTFDLWAKQLSFDKREMSCEHRPDVYYFAPCHGAADCFNYEGAQWQQSKLVEGWAANCSAGSWAVSARHLLEFLRAIRYETALPTEEQFYLVNTELTSGGQPTAVGWERPWSFDSDGDGVTEKYLSKNGANGDDVPESYGDGPSDAAFNNEILRLPHNMDAVLMINTAGLSAAASLFDAYLNTADPANYPLPYFDKEDTLATDELATKVALNEGANISYNVNGDYVTATRRDDGKLRLIAWETEVGNGHIERRDEVTDLKINDVAISDGMDFVTAVRDTQNKLRVISWINSVAGLTREGEATGHEVNEIAVTKARSSGAAGVAVTATRNAAGKVQLDAWKFDHNANTVTPGATKTLALGTGVAIETLKYVGNVLPNDPARIVVAFRNSDDGALWVYVYDVYSDGTMTYKGSKSFGSVFNGQSARRIAIDTRGDNGPFFNGASFLIGSIDAAGNLQVTTWRAGLLEPGFVSKKADYTGGAITSLDVTRATTAVRRAEGDLKLIKWGVDNQGALSLLGDALTGPINQVVAAGHVMTAIRDTGDRFKLIHWTPLP